MIFFFFLLTRSRREAHSLSIIFMGCKTYCDFSAPFGFLSLVLFCFLFVLLFFFLMCLSYITLPLPTFCPLFFLPFFYASATPAVSRLFKAGTRWRASCVICQGDSNALFLFIFEQCLHYQCIRCMARQY